MKKKGFSISTHSLGIQNLKIMLHVEFSKIARFSIFTLLKFDRLTPYICQKNFHESNLKNLSNNKILNEYMLSRAYLSSNTAGLRSS